MSTNSLYVLVCCELLLLLCLILPSTASANTNKKSTRMSRMPLYYGKRSDTSTEESSLRNLYGAERSGSFSIGEVLRSAASGNNQGTSTSEEIMLLNGFPVPEDHPNRILNLDNHYGSKNQQNPRQSPVHSENVERNLQILSRMPAYFGERPSMASEKFNELKLFEENLNKKLLFILPSISHFYGTTVQTGHGWKYLKSKDSNTIKRNSLNRMPAFYGKRVYNFIDFKPTIRDVLSIIKTYLQTHNDNQIPRLQTIASRLSTGEGTMSRQVSATMFNLPETSDTQQEVTTDEYATRLRQNKDKIKAISTDDRGDEQRHNNQFDDTDKNVFSDATELSADDDINLTFNKRRRSSMLDRMPNYFGKRQSGSETLRNFYQNQRSENFISKVPQNKKLINFPFDDSIQYENFQVSLNANDSPSESTETYQTKKGLHKIFDIWPSTQD